jgi:hypothetical protein
MPNCWPSSSKPKPLLPKLLSAHHEVVKPASRSHSRIGRRRFLVGFSRECLLTSDLFL